MRATIKKIVDRELDVVGSVETGWDAFESATQLRPDVLVIDVIMPVLDGREVVRRLKERGSKTKIVFFSVSVAPEVVTSCFGAGGDAYVVKTRLRTDLPLAIKAVLTGKKTCGR